MAGLPGTGLGGIFYALLIVWMAVREAWLSSRGVSERGRWTRIARLGAILAGIVAALWLEGWVLLRLFGFGLLGDVAATSRGRSLAAVEAIVPALALAPLVVLTALIAAVQLARQVSSSAQRQERLAHEAAPPPSRDDLSAGERAPERREGPEDHLLVPARIVAQVE